LVPGCRYIANGVMCGEPRGGDEGAVSLNDGGDWEWGSGVGVLSGAVGKLALVVTG